MGPRRDFASIRASSTCRVECASSAGAAVAAGARRGGGGDRGGGVERRRRSCARSRRAPPPVAAAATASRSRVAALHGLSLAHAHHWDRRSMTAPGPPRPGVASSTTVPSPSSMARAARRAAAAGIARLADAAAPPLSTKDVLPGQRAPWATTHGHEVALGGEAAALRRRSSLRRCLRQQPDHARGMPAEIPAARLRRRRRPLPKTSSADTRRRRLVKAAAAIARAAADAFCDLVELDLCVDPIELTTRRRMPSAPASPPPPPSPRPPRRRAGAGDRAAPPSATAGYRRPRSARSGERRRAASINQCRIAARSRQASCRASSATLVSPRRTRLRTHSDLADCLDRRHHRRPRGESARIGAERAAARRAADPPG